LRVLKVKISVLIVLLLLPGQALYAQANRDQRINVRAVDFALDVPESLRAGTHRWTFTNDGTVRHEFIVVKLPVSLDAQAAVDTLHARGLRAFFPGSQTLGFASSGLFAASHQKSDAELVTRDKRGDRLLVFCQVRDAEGKPRHDEMGMFKVISIR
jgi:hypothetical protein